MRSPCLHTLLVGLGASLAYGAEWVKVSTEASVSQPKPSMAHVAGAFKDGKVVVFGGCTSSCCFAPIDSQWQLSLSDERTSGVWTELTPASRPSARFSAASAVVGDRLLMFGGQDSSQAFLNDLWLYDHANETWTVLDTKGSGRVHTNGPSPRQGSTLTPLDESHLLLYGGFGLTGVMSDAWLLDVASLSWSKLRAEEEPVPHRSGHVAVPTRSAEGGVAVTVFGGYDENGIDTDTTFTLHLDLQGQAVAAASLVADGPSPPVRHGAVALYGMGDVQAVEAFAVFGGVNTTADTLPSSFLGDQYTLDVPLAAWSRDNSTDAAASPMARAYASVAHTPQGDVMYGGFAGYTGDTDDRLLGDVWVYRPTARDSRTAAVVAETMRLRRTKM